MLICRYGIEGLVFLDENRSLPSHLAYDAENMCIYPKEGGLKDPRTLRIFSKVRVKMDVINDGEQRASLTRRKLLMNLIEPSLESRKRGLSTVVS